MARQWYLVGQGDRLDAIDQLIADHQLKVGDRIRCEMRLSAPVGWAFDVAPTWWPSVPQGMKVVDLWGTGWPWEINYGYVEMEVTGTASAAGTATPQFIPVWLAGVFAFIKAHWVVIVIAGVVLLWLVNKVKIWLFGEPPTAPVPPPDGEQNTISQMMTMMVVMMMMVMMMNMMSEAM